MTPLPLTGWILFEQTCYDQFAERVKCGTQNIAKESNVTTTGTFKKESKINMNFTAPIHH